MCPDLLGVNLGKRALRQFRARKLVRQLDTDIKNGQFWYLFLKPESELSSAKRALIEQWRRGQPTKNPEGNGRAIPPRPDPASAPLSFGQQQLWFFNQIEPKSALYNIPIPLRLSGSLNIPALQSAFNAIVTRHEILRSRFLGDPEPVQLIDLPTAVPIQVVDLRKLPAPARQAEA